MSRKINNEKGITLIALIITIIVLIILAGITITLVLGENGIFEKSKIAKEQYTIEAIREKLEMVKGSDYLDKVGDSSIDTYFSTLEDEKIPPYTVTKTEKLSDIAGNVEVDSKYVYLIIIRNNKDIEIEYEGEIGDIDQKPDKIEIALEGEKEQNDLPIKLTVIIKSDRGIITEGKWEKTASNEKLGTNEELYSYNITENTEFTAEQTGDYYIHTLTTDRYGRKQETVSKIIKVSEVLHTHKDANGEIQSEDYKAENAGGCYTRENIATKTTTKICNTLVSVSNGGSYYDNGAGFLVIKCKNGHPHCGSDNTVRST